MSQNHISSIFGKAGTLCLKWLQSSSNQGWKQQIQEFSSALLIPGKKPAVLKPASGEEHISNPRHQMSSGQFEQGKSDCLYRVCVPNKWLMSAIAPPVFLHKPCLINSAFCSIGLLWHYCRTKQRIKKM